MIKVKIRVEGADAILRATARLPEDGKQELEKRSKELADELAHKVVAAANALGRQDALAARSVRAEKGTRPAVTAGQVGGRKSTAVLFGSEFGANARFGWYARERYASSPRRQFRPHIGTGSYWFFRTIEASQEEVSRAYIGAADEVVRKWGAL